MIKTNDRISSHCAGVARVARSRLHFWIGSVLALSTLQPILPVPTGAGMGDRNATRPEATRPGAPAGKAERPPLLSDLSPYNPELRKLKQEIARNLRSTARRGELDRPLRYVRYVVREEDNFFTIMAKVSQSPDTLASANDLLNPNALMPGQELLIPNARGLFVSGKRPEEVARLYRVDPQNLIVEKNTVFLPGGVYGAIQLQYFKGEGFLQPLKTGRISSRFGMRRDPFTRRATFHGGLDIAAPKGTPVYASRDGRVEHAGKAGGYGKLVILGHQFDYQTYYGHLSEVLVKPGQRVRAGQLIGRVGATGRATGNHLHFELRKKGVRKKPSFIHHGRRL